MRNCKSRGVVGMLFVLPDLVGVVVFALAPFLQVVARSFQGAVGGRFVGLANYRSVIGNTAFRKAITNTARFTVVCIPLLVVLSLLLAVGLANLRAGKQLLKSAFLLPMAVPAASVVLVWKLLFHSNGLLNRLILQFELSGFYRAFLKIAADGGALFAGVQPGGGELLTGVQPGGGGLLAGVQSGGGSVAWMTSGMAFWVLVVSYLWKNLGYDMILWLAGLAAISPDIYEAARVDGAGAWQCFFRITLPNLRGSFYTIAVLSFLNSFKVFREAWLVAGDYPHESMYLLQHLYNNWFRELSFEKIAAAAVMHALLVMAMILLLKRIWAREE